MVYRTKQITDKQADRLATWHFRRTMSARWLLLLGIPVLFLSSSGMPLLWGIALLVGIYSIILPLYWLRFRKVWRHDCRQMRSSGFLTVTDAGILTETEGLASFHPWVFYQDATLVGDTLVLSLSGNQPRVWNLEASPIERRESLLRFVREHLGKKTSPAMAPPRSIYSTISVAQPETLAQVLEMGDIIQHQRETTNLWYRAILTLLSIILLFICAMQGIENNWQDSRQIIYCAIFAFLAYRGIRFLFHPGRYLLQQNLRAFRNTSGIEDVRVSDGHSEIIHRQNGSWLRADYAAMQHCIKGRHVVVAHIQRTIFAWPADTAPAGIAPPVAYKPASGALYTVLGLTAALLAGCGYLLWVSPHYPFSYLIWLFSAH